MGSNESQQPPNLRMSATPCTFPRLSNASENPSNSDRTEKLEIEAANLCASSNSSNIEPWVFAVAVWAVVLQCFTETECVQLWLCTNQGAITDLEQLLVIPVKKGKTIRELCHTQDWSLVRVKGPGLANSNVGIALDESISLDNIPISTDTAIEETPTSCDILLHLRYEGDQLEIALEYKEPLLCHTMAKHLASTIQQGLTAAHNQIDDPLSALCLVSDLNLQQIKAWSGDTHYKQETSPWWHQLKQLAQSLSDKTAIASWDGHMSFAELDRVSSQAAHYLQNAGVRPNTWIPVCFEKSIWAIIAAIGIHKTGAAFVPLEPTQPLARLEQIIKAVGTNLVVTSSHYANHLRSVSKSLVISAESIPDSPLPETFAPHSPDMSSPAYCLFTSGSTGHPKGCIISHSAFANIVSQIPAMHLHENSRVLQFASYSFSISIVEIYCTLSAGGTVCIPSDKDRSSIGSLVTAINQLAVSNMITTPTVLGAIQPDTVPSIQTVVTGGEPLQHSQALTWAGKVSLYQALGMTEWAGTVCISERITLSTHRASIGRPTNGQIWLADPGNHTRLAPIGSVAELFIQGPCLAQGYVDDRKKTNVAFLARPPWQATLGQSDQGRVYRTGDLVRFLPDGSLEHVGRKDTQLKIRGQRVELGDVEFHVKNCYPESIKVVAEVLTPCGHGGQQILAALIQQPSKTVCEEDVQWFAPSDMGFQAQAARAQETLRSHLPRYMVPTHFILIHHFPRTVSGKIDRMRLRRDLNNLPRREFLSLVETKQDMLPPSSEIEAQLMSLLAEVLKNTSRNMGVNQNFFHLGGDSIKALKLVGLAREKGIGLTVNDILQHPVISEMAAVSFQTERAINQTVDAFALIDSSAKESILESAAKQCGVSVGQIADVYPCSPLQAGLFALSVQNPGSYMGRSIYELRPDINVSRLKAAWETVVTKHEVLRTRFIQLTTGEILQVVLDSAPVWDDATSKDEYLDNPDRLETGLGKPLLRSCMVHEGPSSGKTYLILTMHHSISDRWALGLNMQQLEATYRGESMKTTPFNQFIRYVIKAKDDEAFWSTQFKGLTCAPFPRLPSPSFKPTSNHKLEIEMRIPKVVMRGFTMSTAIQVAWGLVLSRYTSADDLVFGLTLTGRAASIAGIEKMPGPTITTVPMRVRIAPDAITSHFLKAQQEKIVRITPYEQTGLQRMRTFSPESELACSFQNHLIIQSPWESDGESLFVTTVDSEAIAGGFANSPLVVTCQLGADPQNVIASVRFDARLITKQEVQRLLWSLQSTLCSMLTDYDRPLRALPSISPQDLEQLVQWNPLPTYTKSSVTALILENCSRSGHRPAVDAWDGQFTYVTLDKLSTCLARHLVARGVKPQSYIPIYTEKSRWAVVAMLAVLKTGAAIMFLDPSQPVKRLKENCQAAQVSLIVASPTKVDSALDLAPDVVVSTGDYSRWTVDQSLEIPETQPDWPLYTVFTSGSTGKPKGVKIDHTTFLAAAIPFIKKAGIDTSCRWLQFCSYSFDVATVEQLWALVAGGCVCIPRDEQRLNGINEAAAVLRPTHTLLTPSFAYTLNPDEFPSLQVLLLGGEPVQAKDIQKWAHRLRLVNSYGPAEAGSTYKNLHVKPDSIPNTIGHAMGGRSWLVHPQDANQLVPIGAVGELLMNGPYVGLGYLGDSEQTAAAFISSPPWLEDLNRSLSCANDPRDPLCRLYKTGDLFCYNMDGSLRYVGRKDTQVKLRGQRIELGEVEWHIQDLFEDAVNVVAEVVPSIGSQMSSSLVAFVHCAVNEADISENYFLPSSAEFRKRCATATTELRDRIPGYMIPSLILPVSRLPQGATGKIDRKFLRAAVVAMSDSECSEYRMATEEKKRAPTTETEKRLHTIWSEVLKLSPSEIGIDDNFFHLGGDSINAMYMAARARAEGIALTVTDILANPKLSTLATLQLGELDNHSYKAIPFSLVDAGTRDSAIKEAMHLGLASDVSQIADVLPMTDGQLFLLTQWTPVYQCHDLEGPVDVDRLRAACRAVIANHSILRTAFIRTGGNSVQVILKSLDRPLRHITTNESPIMYCDSLAQADSQISSTVNSAPLDFSLVSNSSTRHGFIIRISHAQYDGLSIPVLLNDIAAEYSGTRTCVPMDYSSYMYFRASKTTDKAFTFWRDYLHGSSIENISLTFPTAYSASQSGPADRRITAAKEIPLPTAPAGITTANLVKAACALVLARVSAQNDLILGQTVNGRSLPLPNIDKVLGPCLNSIPLRVTLQDKWTAQDLMRHVQAQSMSTLAYDYLDSPEIIRQSTDWPAETRFSCVIQHQNLERTLGIRLGETTATLVGWAHFVPDSGLWIISTPGESSLDVMLCTSQGVMSMETARGLVEKICATIQSFVTGTNNYKNMVEFI
nr:PlmJ [Aspergillus flavipes]